MGAVEALYGNTLETGLRIFKGAVAAKASDVHLRVGAPPLVRISGELCPFEHPPLSPEQIDATVSALMGWGGVPADSRSDKQLEFSCEVPDVGRFRVHTYRQRGGPACVVRHIPTPIPEFADLRVPAVIKRIALENRGFVLVTGATGNGKSTTIAAVLQYINRKTSKHIVTIEEPIEFVFDDDRASFSQREIGRDVDSMADGLRGALREDPDVIFIGEIRSPDEFEIALNAAEAGHLIVSTFHSTDSSSTVARMINMYPQDYRDSARQRIADSLTAIVSQRLVPQRGGTDRILVTEVLRKTPTVQDCIRDASRFRALPAALDAATHEYGTHSLDNQLLSMLKDGLIALDTAKAAARSPKDLIRSLKLNR